MQVERQLLDVTERRLVIDLPESFVNHRVEVIVLTIDEQTLPSTGRRKPHPSIAGKGRTLGDLISPIVDEGDWEGLN